MLRCDAIPATITNPDGIVNFLKNKANPPLCAKDDIHNITVSPTVLYGSSANCLTTTLTSTKPDSQKYFMKFQVKSKADNITIDGLNGHIINRLSETTFGLGDISEYFSKFVDGFKTTIVCKTGPGKKETQTDKLPPRVVLNYTYPFTDLCQGRQINLGTQDPLGIQREEMPAKLHIQKALPFASSTSEYESDDNYIALSKFLEYDPDKIFNTMKKSLLNIFKVITQLAQYGFSHNDCHLENILITRDGTKMKLIDFGRCYFNVDAITKKEQDQLKRVMLITQLKDIITSNDPGKSGDYQSFIQTYGRKTFLSDELKAKLPGKTQLPIGAYPGTTGKIEDKWKFAHMFDNSTIAMLYLRETNSSIIGFEGGWIVTYPLSWYYDKLAKTNNMQLDYYLYEGVCVFLEYCNNHTLSNTIIEKQDLVWRINHNYLTYTLAHVWSYFQYMYIEDNIWEALLKIYDVNAARIDLEKVKTRDAKTNAQAKAKANAQAKAQASSFKLPQIQQKTKFAKRTPYHTQQLGQYFLPQLAPKQVLVSKPVVNTVVKPPPPIKLPQLIFATNGDYISELERTAYTKKRMQARHFVQLYAIHNINVEENDNLGQKLKNYCNEFDKLFINNQVRRKDAENLHAIHQMWDGISNLLTRASVAVYAARLLNPDLHGGCPPGVQCPNGPMVSMTTTTTETPYRISSIKNVPVKRERTTLTSMMKGNPAKTNARPVPVAAPNLETNSDGLEQRAELSDLEIQQYTIIEFLDSKVDNFVSGQYVPKNIEDIQDIMEYANCLYKADVVTDKKSVPPHSVLMLNWLYLATKDEQPPQPAPHNALLPLGGGVLHPYNVFKDKTTKRQFIRKSGKRWYLDEHRGRYRYADKSKTKVYPKFSK